MANRKKPSLRDLEKKFERALDRKRPKKRAKKRASTTAVKRRRVVRRDDNLSIRHGVDRRTINLKEPWEIKYWTKELKISEHRLRYLLSRFGKSTDSIREAIYRGIGTDFKPTVRKRGAPKKRTSVGRTPAQRAATAKLVAMNKARSKGRYQGFQLEERARRGRSMQYVGRDARAKQKFHVGDVVGHHLLGTGRVVGSRGNKVTVRWDDGGVSSESPRTLKLRGFPPGSGPSRDVGRGVHIISLAEQRRRLKDGRPRRGASFEEVSRFREAEFAKAQRARKNRRKGEKLIVDSRTSKRSSSRRKKSSNRDFRQGSGRGSQRRGRRDGQDYRDLMSKRGFRD